MTLLPPPVPIPPGRVEAQEIRRAARVLVANELSSLHQYHQDSLYAPEPWSSPHAEVLAKQLQHRIWKAGPAGNAVKLKTPQSTRPVFVPHDPDDLLVLGLLAARLRDALSPERRSWYGSALYANLPTAPGEDLLAQPYLTGLTAINTALLKRVQVMPVLLCLDISKFYEQIDHALLIELARREGVLDTDGLWLLQELLNGFARRFDPPLHRGLPQSYPALSAQLAEVYLLPLDRALLAKPGLIYSRYVDDLRIHLESVEEAEGLVCEVEALLRPLGLALADKTTIYDSRVQPPSDLPLIGGVASARLPEDVLRLTDLLPTHPMFPDAQVALKALWTSRGAVQAGRPFERTVVRFCLHRLTPHPSLIPDVIDVLRQHPEEYQVVTTFLKRLRPEDVPWQALQDVLRRPHHASAALHLLQGLAPYRAVTDPDHPARSWLELLDHHTSLEVKEAAACIYRRWAVKGQTRELITAIPKTGSLEDLEQALADHLGLSTGSLKLESNPTGSWSAQRLADLLIHVRRMEIQYQTRSERYPRSAQILCQRLPEAFSGALDISSIPTFTTRTEKRAVLRGQVEQARHTLRARAESRRRAKP